MIQRALAALILLCALTLPAAAENDIVHFGNSIVVSEGQSTGDVVCFFCSVEVKNKVHGDVVVFFGSVKLEEPVEGDVVVFGGSVWVDGFASVAHDVVIFGGFLHADQGNAVGGDRVIFPPIIFLPVFLVLAAILWGFWLLIRWLIHGRQTYYPMPPR